MKQRLLSFLVLMLGLLLFSSPDLSAGHGKGIDSIWVKNQNATHIKMGWNNVSDAIQYNIVIQGEGQEYTFKTGNTWWKINKDFLINNDGDVIKFEVTVLRGDGTYSVPFGGPLVEVEIIYDRCDDADFDLEEQYFIYGNLGTTASTLVTMEKPIQGECFRDYRDYHHGEFDNGPISNDPYIPDCNASCINSYAPKGHLYGLFATLNYHSYIYAYRNDICGPAKTGDTPTEIPQLYHLSPNPLSNSLFVSQAMYETSDAHNILRIYNSQGKLMIEQQLDDAVTTEVDTESLPTGIYISNILRDGEIVQKSKLLKL